MTAGAGRGAPDPRTGRVPSTLWMWGFWLCVGAAIAAYVASTIAAAPADRALRGIAGVLLVAGGVHQARVVRYKVVTRGPYSTLGPRSYLVQRQTGWSAIVLGALFVASAFVEM